MRKEPSNVKPEERIEEEESREGERVFIEILILLFYCQVFYDW